jgi:hypothetical protein
MTKSDNDLYQILSDIDPSRGAVEWAKENAVQKNALDSLPVNLQLPYDLKSMVDGSRTISKGERAAGTLLVKLIFAQAVYWRRASEAFMRRACEDPRNGKRMLSLEDAEELCKLYRRRDELVDQLGSKLLSSGWPQIQPGQMDGIDKAVDKELSAIAAKIHKIWRAGPEHGELDPIFDLKYPWTNSEHESVDLLRALGVVETRFKVIWRGIRFHWSEEYDLDDLRRALKIEPDKLRSARNIEPDELVRVPKIGLAKFKTLCKAKRGRWVHKTELQKLQINPAKFKTRWEKCLGGKSGRKTVYTWEVALECLQARLRAMSAATRVEVAKELLEHNPPETGEWKSSDALAELGKIIDEAMKGKAIRKGGARPARRKANQ